MALKSTLKEASQVLFLAAQRAGLFVAPRHYYVPLASWPDLARDRARWNRPIDLAAVRIDLDEEIEVLNAWIDDEVREEIAGNAAYKAAIAAQAGPGYGYIEAQVLHGFMRSVAPPRVIEIGSGVSTYCMLAASERNRQDGRSESRVTCVEPYPSQTLKGYPVDLVAEAVEKVDLTIFDALRSGDFLFIDSSHAVRPCGDVSRLYLEVLPRLQSGVHVHIHDIYLPYAFQRDLKGYMQWMETAMLIALLSHSSKYKVSLSLSHLHYSAPEKMKRALPEYDPQPNDGGLRGDSRTDHDQHFPSSTYLRVL